MPSARARSYSGWVEARCQGMKNHDMGERERRGENPFKKVGGEGKERWQNMGRRPGGGKVIFIGIGFSG